MSEDMVDRVAWQPIGSAPLDAPRMMVTDNGETISVAHFAEGIWWLGSVEDAFDEPIDHPVNYWLPWSYPKNPFQAPFAVAALGGEGR